MSDTIYAFVGQGQFLSEERSKPYINTVQRVLVRENCSWHQNPAGKAQALPVTSAAGGA